MDKSEVRARIEQARLRRASADAVGTKVPKSAKRRSKEPTEGEKLVKRPLKKFTPEVVDVLLQYLRDGNYRSTACQAAGISQEIFYVWMKQGADGNDFYVPFYHAVLEAEAQAEVKLLEGVMEHTGKDWRAGMEVLSRRFPERWSVKAQHELTGLKGGAIEIVVTYDQDGEDEADPDDLMYEEDED